VNATDPKRRRLLQMGLGAALAPLAGCKIPFSSEQGLFNSCLPSNPALLNDPLVKAAWEGLRTDRVWDVHAHLFGNGRSKTGIWMSPEFDEPKMPAAYVRRMMFINGGCAGSDEPRLDQAMIDRLKNLVAQMPPGVKVMLLGFDFTYDDAGQQRRDLTTFSIPNEYAARVAKSDPSRFEWVASIHPYREDALEALAQAKAAGARAVKWLPPSMGIDLAHAKSRAFYDGLRRHNVPLLVHLGEEQAVPGAERHEFANPLSVRHALDRGVRVIAAHCASLGKGNFEAFTQLMAERQYERLLFGDISAVTQANRADVLPLILAKREWHGRLLNGTDYPLPGIMPLFSVSGFVKAGLLDESKVATIRSLRDVNPLLFDFVLKRNLRYDGAAFPASVFETRPFFEADHGRS
jgi:predicted TIM-barrel fold metal-dependent hydrolase